MYNNNIIIHTNGIIIINYGITTIVYHSIDNILYKWVGLL